MSGTSAGPTMEEADEGDDSFETGGLVAEPDHACLRRLSWRVRRVDRAAIDTVRLADSLVALGLEDSSRIAGLRVVRDASGHELLLVHSTGRIQVRIHYSVPPPDRRAVARALVDRLAALGAGGGRG